MSKLRDFWGKVDWNLRDIDIAAQYNISREAVRLARKRLGKPKSPHHRMGKLEIKIKTLKESMTPREFVERGHWDNYETGYKALKKSGMYKSGLLRKTVSYPISPEHWKELKQKTGCTLKDLAILAGIKYNSFVFLYYGKKRIGVNDQKRLLPLFKKWGIEVDTQKIVHFHRKLRGYREHS